MFLKRLLVGLILFTLVASSCSKYQKLVKSGDTEAKYAAAIDLYEKKDYYRSLQLFTQLLTFYQGTEKGQKMEFYVAYCYFNQRDYILASYYFKRFAQNYPRSELAEEAMFQSAYCYYLDSPKSSLDQTNTYAAINELTLFMDLFPRSERVGEAEKLIGELRAKLERKDLDNANMYFKMDDYEAAITSYKNVLKDYPDTDEEEGILFRIFKSHYNFAIKSILAKQAERYQLAIDSYNELIFQYPQTEYRKEADNLYQDIQKRLSAGDFSKNN